MFKQLMLVLGIAAIGFKAGDYRLKVDGQKIKIVDGKREVELAATVETGDQKFAATTVRYADQGGKVTIAEIRLGGTRTKLVFNQ
jgi:hypothetical protein